MHNAVDIVITWVDGSDPEWLAEKSKYTPGKNNDDRVNRYRDWGFLPYLFRGIEQYAPWVRKVHFITWGHLPQWLNTDNPKLNIVKHSDYIPEKYLPVFSANPIELNFCHIDDLAEQFIYFNDDTLLINPADVETFFKDGKPVDTVCEIPLRFNPGGIDHIIGNDMMLINKNFNKREVIKKNFKKWFSLRSPKATLKNLYMFAANGFSQFDNPHLPLPLLKNTIKTLWEKENAMLDDTCSHRFRSNDDVNQWLIRYWQFATGNFVQASKPQGKFFSIGKHNKEIEEALAGSKYKMVCLSDDTPDLDFEKEQKFVLELLGKKFPEKSSFEK